MTQRARVRMQHLIAMLRHRTVDAATLFDEPDPIDSDEEPETPV